ncbi:MAG TPA: CDP-alcohol phosphatidyltransferase family protein [Actinomycetales bacterium]|nr:CDP-alcohol phosphatidyltransferase family protein [Actinomycetales bacterium]
MWAHGGGARGSDLGASFAALGEAQKGSRGVSLYSRYINRPSGRLLAAAADVVGLTPNQVTLLSAAFTVAGAALLALARPSVTQSVLVWLCLALGFALDSADGQLARIRGGGTPAGQWLDHVVDAGKMVLVHLAVLVRLYRYTPMNDAGLLVPMAFALVSTLVFTGGTLVPLVRRGGHEAAPRPDSTIAAIGLLPADYGVFCLVFLLGWHEHLFFVGYSLLLAVNVVLMCLLLGKWFRELSRT